MPNVKTAISVEKPVFDQMEALSRKMKISRSRAFSLAAQEFIQRRENRELLDALNAAYDEPSESDPAVSRMGSKHHDIVEDEW